MESSGFRILVVDDYEPFRRFICSTLSNQQRLRVIGEACDGLDAVQKAQDLRPDLILLDIGLPTFNGIEAARRICNLSPGSKILFVSQQSSPDLVRAALDTGARGYVVKSDVTGDLLPAIETVIRDKVFVSSCLTDCGLINSEDEHQARSGKVVSRFRMQRVEKNHEPRFYSDDSGFVDDFAHSIEAAFENGNAVLVVTTESHRENLLQKLKADGVDVDTATERNLYISIDVPDSLSTAVDASTGKEGIPKDVRHAIVEALQTAKEKDLHLAVG